MLREGHNVFWSREDGEIQAEFLPGNSWFSRSQISNGEWQQATNQGEGDFASAPLFMAGWPNVNLKLQTASPAIDSGTMEKAPSVDIMCMKRPAGNGTDIGAYEMNSTPDPDCEVSTEIKKPKKGFSRR